MSCCRIQWLFIRSEPESSKVTHFMSSVIIHRMVSGSVIFGLFTRTWAPKGLFWWITAEKALPSSSCRNQWFFIIYERDYPKSLILHQSEWFFIRSEPESSKITNFMSIFILCRTVIHNLSFGCFLLTVHQKRVFCTFHEQFHHAQNGIWICHFWPFPTYWGSKRSVLRG